MLDLNTKETNMKGGKREGAGRPKAAPTKVITFRVPIIWITEIKTMVKERMTELRKGLTIILTLCLVSCSALKLPEGNKTCIVTNKQASHGNYFNYTCKTITTQKTIYLTGFENDANVNDTVKVKYDQLGFAYILKQ